MNLTVNRIVIIIILSTKKWDVLRVGFEPTNFAVFDLKSNPLTSSGIEAEEQNRARALWKDQRILFGKPFFHLNMIVFKQDSQHELLCTIDKQEFL